MTSFYSSLDAGITVSRQFFTALSITVLVSCTTVPTVEQAAVLDIGTTVVGLAAGGTELNPLGVLGVSILKAVYISGLFGRTEESDRTATSLWTGAAANNITGVVTFNPLLSLAVGVTVGYYIYTFKKPAEK